MANGSNEISTRSGDNKGFVHAVMNEDLQAISYYQSIGMDINFMDPEIMTSPMIEATRSQNLEIVEQLLNHGGDPKRISQFGESAMSVAKASNNQELLGLLDTEEPYRSRFISFWKKVFN